MCKYFIYAAINLTLKIAYIFWAYSKTAYSAIMLVVVVKLRTQKKNLRRHPIKENSFIWMRLK